METLNLVEIYSTVDVGEENPRTVCTGIVGSVTLEELQVLCDTYVEGRGGLVTQQVSKPCLAFAN